MKSCWQETSSIKLQGRKYQMKTLFRWRSTATAHISTCCNSLVENYFIKATHDTII